jgi:hypothetical protein
VRGRKEEGKEKRKEGKAATIQNEQGEVGRYYDVFTRLFAPTVENPRLFYE